MSIWLLAGVSSAALAAGQRLLVRWRLRDEAHAAEFASAFQIVSMVFVLPVGLAGVFAAGNQWSARALVLAAAAVLCWLSYSHLTFRSDVFLDASSKASLSRLRLLWGLVIGVVVFGERANWLWVPASLLLVAGSFIAVALADRLATRGVVLELGATIAIAAAIAFDKLTLGHLNVVTVTFISFGGPGVVEFVRGRTRVRSTSNYWLADARRLMIVAVGSLAMIGSFALQLVALDDGPLSAVVAVAAVSAVLTTLGGIVLLGERSDLTRKLVGLVATSVAAIMLAAATS